MYKHTYLWILFAVSVCIIESKILLKFVTHNYCIYGKYIISSNFSVLFDIFLSIQGIETYVFGIITLLEFYILGMRFQRGNSRWLLIKIYRAYIFNTSCQKL